MVEMSRHLSAPQFNVESSSACTKDKTKRGHHRVGQLQGGSYHYFPLENT